MTHPQLDHLFPPDRSAPWEELVAADADALERELRGRLAAMRAGGPSWSTTTVETSQAKYAQRRITLSEHEIQVVLRVLLPTALGTRRSSAAAHVALHAAIGGWLSASCRLVVRQVPLFAAAMVAGVALRAAIDGWLRAVGWQLACLRAHVRWRYPIAHERLPITLLTQQQTLNLQNTTGTMPIAADAAIGISPRPARLRRVHPATGQRTLLLPIAGRSMSAADTPNGKPEIADRHNAAADDTRDRDPARRRPRAADGLTR